ncbi:hypothetical protein M2399_004185 [Pseudomonas sp. BIGb0450]|nr:hypothetical protein [Pseudomonas sp. BIGb0450]
MARLRWDHRGVPGRLSRQHRGQARLPQRRHCTSQGMHSKFASDTPLKCGSCRALARLRWDHRGVPGRLSRQHRGQARLPQMWHCTSHGMHSKFGRDTPLMWELSSLGEAAMGSPRCARETESPASRASPAPTEVALHLTGNAFQIWARHTSNVGAVEPWPGCDGITAVCQGDRVASIAGKPGSHRCGIAPHTECIPNLGATHL